MEARQRSALTSIHDTDHGSVRPNTPLRPIYADGLPSSSLYAMVDRIPF